MTSPSLALLRCLVDAWDNPGQISWFIVLQDVISDARILLDADIEKRVEEISALFEEREAKAHYLCPKCLDEYLDKNGRCPKCSVGPENLEKQA